LGGNVKCGGAEKVGIGTGQKDLAAKGKGRGAGPNGPSDMGVVNVVEIADHQPGARLFPLRPDSDWLDRLNRRLTYSRSGALGG